MRKNIHNKRVFLFVLVLGFSVFALEAAATEVAWPRTPFWNTSFPEEGGINLLVKYLYEWGISLGGLAAFIVLLIAGFQYLASTGSPTLMREAKSRMVSAGLGLGLLLSSWLILNTINPQFTQFPPLSITVEIKKTIVEPFLYDPASFPKCDHVLITIYRDAGGRETIGTTGGSVENPYCNNIRADWETSPINKGDSMDIVFYKEAGGKPCLIGIDTEPCYIDPGPDGEKNPDNPNHPVNDDNIEYRVCRGTLIFYGREDCEDQVLQIGGSTRGVTGFNRNILSFQMLLTECY